jgi:hypothetical protein
MVASCRAVEPVRSAALLYSDSCGSPGLLQLGSSPSRRDPAWIALSLSGQPFGGNSLHRNMPDFSFNGNCVEVYLCAFNHAKLPEIVHFC